MTASRGFEWVDEDDAFADVCRAASKAESFAVDTEFHRERTYYPHVALLQLRWADTIALVDPLVVDMAPLADLLQSGALPILHAADQDLEVFRRACGALPSRMFDTQIVANFAGFSTPSLASLVERIVGLKLPKGDRMTDWTRRPLSESQLVYAAADVEHLQTIREYLSNELEPRGRLRWAEDECAASLARAAAPGDPDVAWWRIKEARQCRGQARAIAQEVAAWRERRAQATDVPIRFVLADLAVAGIAQAAPSSVQQLNAVRGLSGRGVRGDVAEEILAAVERGKSLPPEKIRVPLTDDLEREQRPAAALAAAWVAQLARQERIDATMLATRADLTSFLAGNADARLRHGWRAELVGRPLARLVGGDAALVFDGNGGLLLEERSGRALNGRL